MTTYYVDTVDGNDGTGDGSAGAPYQTLQAAESNLNGDITATGSNDTAFEIHCSGGADTSEPAFAGWTTDATHQIALKGDPTGVGANTGDGKNDGDALSLSYYYLQNNTTGDALNIGSGADHVVVDGLQFRNNNSGTGDDCIFIGAKASGSTVDVRNCRFYCLTTNNNNRGVHVNDADCTLSVYNCTFDWTDGATSNLNRALFLNNCAGADVYNCVFVGPGTNGDGIEISSGLTGITIQNCAFAEWNLDIDDAGATSPTIDYNLDQDSTARGTSGAAIGTLSSAFTDYANGDFTPTDGSSPLVTTGGTTGGLSTDINGASYSGVTQEIGAFVAPATGGETIAMNKVTLSLTETAATVKETVTPGKVTMNMTGAAFTPDISITMVAAALTLAVGAATVKDVIATAAANVTVTAKTFLIDVTETMQTAILSLIERPFSFAGEVVRIAQHVGGVVRPRIRALVRGHAPRGELDG